MKPRSDSLFAELTRLNLLDEFFAFVSAQMPSYDEMRKWLAERNQRASLAALHNLVTYHMGVWNASQAVKASEEVTFDLPEGADERLRKRIAALKFDLTMRDLSVQQQLAVWKLDQTERELSNKERSAREMAVDALLAEADGNEEAKAHLANFLAALDSGQCTVNSGQQNQLSTDHCPLTTQKRKGGAG
jgi:hypothetical protein